MAQHLRIPTTTCSVKVAYPREATHGIIQMIWVLRSDTAIFLDNHLVKQREG